MRAVIGWLVLVASVGVESAYANVYVHKAPVRGLVYSEEANIELSSNLLAFNQTGVGSTISRTISVHNSSSVQSLTGVRAALDSTPFSFASNTCGSAASPVTLPPLSTCSATISFSPDSIGAYTGTFSVAADNSSSGVQSAVLSGEGIGVPNISEVGVGATSGSVLQGESFLYPFTFTNSGSAIATGLLATVTGSEFSISNSTCGQGGSPIELAQGQSCSVNVLGSSLNVGTFNGNLTLTHVGATSAISRQLTLVSQQTTAYAATSNGAVDFGSIVYDSSNSTYVDRSVNITNTGNSALTINTVSGLSAGTVFQSSTCSNVAVNGTCALVFRLKSDGITSFTNAPITLNGPTGQDAITLTGSVVAQTRIATVTAGAPVDFGTVVQNTANVVKVVTVQNTGNSSLNISSVTGLPSAVTLAGNTCSAVAANAYCSLTFTMSTASAITFSGATVTTVGGTSNASFTMSGTVSASSVALSYSGTSATSFNFGTLALGSSSTKSVSLKNTGSSTLTGVYVSLPSNPNLTISSNSCGDSGSPVSLAVDAICAISLTYSGSSVDTITGQNVSVQSTQGASKSIPLKGNISGTYANWSSSSSSVVAPTSTLTDFGTLSTDSSAITRTIYVVNSGVGSMNLGVQLTGDVSDIKVTSATKGSTSNADCGAVVASDGASMLGCLTNDASLTQNQMKLVFSFKPITAGSKSVSVALTSENGTVLPTSITLTAVGTDPASVLNMTFEAGTLSDTLGRTVATAGAPVPTVSSSNAYNSGYSAQFTRGGYLRVQNTSPDFGLGLSNFTIDADIYLSSAQGTYTQQQILDFRPTSTNGAYPLIFIDGSNKLVFFANSVAKMTSPSSIPSGQWTHVSIVREGSVVKMLINGSVVATASDTISYATGTTVSIGAGNNPLGSNGFSGFMDNVRVIKGSAVY